MKKVILCSLLLFLSGCGLFKSNEPTKIDVAQIDANNVVDSFFKEYKPIKESEIITTKYVSCHKKVTMCTSVLISSINKLSLIF